MKKINFLFAVAIVSVSLLSACNQEAKKEEAATNTTQEQAPAAMADSNIIRDKVLTPDEQKALTPDVVIQSLLDGNKKFMNNDLSERDHSSMVRSAANGQYPKAVIISCLDSRVPVEDVFNKGLGDLFVGRVAGNFVNEDLIGSAEFGCKVAGAKVIMVLGHGSCGAIKATIDDVKLGNITQMLTKIKPAVTASQSFEGDKTSKNDAFVDAVAKKNVQVAMDKIRTTSPILKEMEDKGEIKIVGAFYNINTGEVTSL